MIDFLQGISGCRLHFAEINQYAVCLQRFARRTTSILPVVSVEVFTLPSKVLQIMSRPKAADYLYFKKLLAQNQILLFRSRPSQGTSKSSQTGKKPPGAH